MIMDLCEGGDLGQYTGTKLEQSGRTPLAEHQLRGFAAQIMFALDYLHTRRIIHHDVKPQNLLLTLGGGLKLADLGLAQQIDEAKPVSTRRCGTPGYMSPEFYTNPNCEHDCGSDWQAIEGAREHSTIASSSSSSSRTSYLGRF